MIPSDPHAVDTGNAAVRANVVAHAGAMLREAREAAGFPLEMIAQQLKLAPRQVKALEDGDYTLLPGRTFVRGFARNYARLVGLDPQAVVDALPGATPEGGLEAPPLHATAVKIGELPSTTKVTPGWLRWMVPLLLVITIGATVAYQHFRGNLFGVASVETAPAPEAAPTTAAGGEPAGHPAGATALPDAVVSPPLATMPAPAAPPASPEAAPAGSASTAAPTPPAGGEASTVSLAITTRAPSWVEVIDASGERLVAQTVPGGQTQAVSGKPPVSLVIGNAAGVTLTLRGSPVDLEPYTRGNVARLQLK